MQSNTAVPSVNIGKHRRSVVFVNINKQGSTVQRKHTKREEKVKLDKEAHQDARQNVKLDPC